MAEHKITTLLEAHRLGEAGALDKAFDLIYEELRRLARYQLRGQGKGQTLDTTSLVHELYLKLAKTSQPALESRAHFLALATRAMRQIIVDYARSQAALKRGGDAVRVTMNTDIPRVEDQAEWILTVDQALASVREVDERLEQVFECRFFAGLSEQESADALGVSVSTIQRDWRRAKAWLRETLADA